jgi:DNA polymerase III subunit gamma/tau
LSTTEVLARKYRPKRFDDLVGQETIAQTLSLALDSDRLAHAYLLSGLRGSGKTSTARIFAKSLVCDQGPSSHPCETCTHCVMANEGRHIDIVEMDAASSRKIDDIRDLIEQTKYKPASARFKIFIIDEVHMLTKEAFNALLKTLEEPPAFVKFILATTDPLKLPATILSRTQHFRFKRISDRDITNHLAHILNTENIGFEPPALSIIARAGSGSLRDSLTLLDQAIIYSKNYVDVNTVTDMLGLVDPEKINILFNNIFAKNQAAILDFVHEMMDNEASMVIDELIAFLKDRLFLQDNMKFNTLIIERFFRILSESKSLIAINADGSFVLTLIFFKMFEALKLKDIDEMISALETDIASHPPIQAQTIPTPTIEQPQAPAQVEEALPEIQIEVATPEPVPSQGEVFMQKLSLKLLDRNLELGESFNQAVTLLSFESDTLTLQFHAPEATLTPLRKYYKDILLPFISEIFGESVKVVIKSKPWEEPEEEKKNSNEPVVNPTINIQATQASGLTNYAPDLSAEPTQATPEATIPTQAPEEDPNGSGSCVVGCSDDVPADKSPEFDRGAILQDPMVQKAIELFAIEGKPVKIQNKI